MSPVLCLLGICLTTAPPLSPGERQEYDRVTKAALAQRQRIDSIRGTAQVTFRELDKKEPDVHTTIRFACTKSQMRSDLTVSTVPGETRVSCLNCIKPGYLLMWGDLGKGTALLGKVIDAPMYLVHRPIEPRQFGYTLAETRVFHHYRYDNLDIFLPLEAVVSVTRETIENTDCVVVRAVNPGVVDMNVAFDQQRGSHPIRVIKRYLNFKPAEVTTLKNELKEVAPGIWFPTRTTYRHAVDAPKGELLREEIVTLTDIVVNQPIPDSVFAPGTTPESIQLENNCRIKVSPDGKNMDQRVSYIWRNGKLMNYDDAVSAVRMEEAANVVPEAPIPVPLVPAGRWPKWLTYTAAGVLLIGAGVLVRLALKRRAA